MSAHASPRVSGFVKSAMLLLALAVGSLAGGAPNSDSADGAIGKLLGERQAVLQDAVRAAEESYRSGQVGFDAVHALQGALLQADLELTKSPQERLSLFGHWVETSKAAEEVTAQLYKAGQATQIDYLKSKATRLQAEIDLKRAEAALNSTSNK
jgi:outer membrane protein TolC